MSLEKKESVVQHYKQHHSKVLLSSYLLSFLFLFFLLTSGFHPQTFLEPPSLQESTAQ